MLKTFYLFQGSELFSRVSFGHRLFFCISRVTLRPESLSWREAGTGILPMDHCSRNPAVAFHWLSFAYQGLTDIPYDAILAQEDALEVLDLSYNLLDEYPFTVYVIWPLLLNWIQTVTEAQSGLGISYKRKNVIVAQMQQLQRNSRRWFKQI